MANQQLLETLPERMTAHAQLFDSLLHLIPAKFYVTEKNDDPTGSKFMHNKRKKAPKQVIKEATKKAKKAKLDPENKKSIAEIQQEKAAQLKEEEEEDAEAEEGIDSEDDSEPEEDNEEPKKVHLGNSKFSGLGDDEEEESVSITATTEAIVPVQPMQQGSISDLRDRLQERIASMRQKRHAPGTENAKARSRQDVLAARLKKKEDRKKALKAQKEKGGKATSEELVKDPTYSKPSAASRPSADSIKMDGDLYFGKLDVGNEQKKKKGPSDAKTQLKKVEAKQEKLEKLKAEDKEKAAAMEEKEDWQKAIAMAQGEKFKDDVKLLKKTIKREEKQKSKSAEKWNERLDKVKRDEQYKVKKRNENLQKHIDFKTSKHKGGKKDKGKSKSKSSDNKGGKGGKGGKARPGFEGGKRSKDGKVTKGKK